MISCNAFKKQAKTPDSFQLTDAEIKHAQELIGTNDCLTCQTIARNAFSKK
jgi:hypothetical protein